MANSSRRVAPLQEYYAVPQSPRSRGHVPMNSMPQPYGPRPPARSSSIGSTSRVPASRGAVAQGVATGAIGGGYGPYSVSQLSLAIAWNGPDEYAV
jgi:beta-glucan synthesis-associated protein KRE6